MFRKTTVLLLLLELLLPLPPLRAAELEKPLIATSIPILAGIVDAIGGDGIGVTSLISGNIDPHAFEARPSDTIKARKARLVIGIGGGFDTWVLGLIDQNGASSGCQPLILLDNVSTENLSMDPSHPDHLDPHVWLDPILVRDLLLPLIASRMKSCFPEVADISDREQRLREKLTALDLEIRQGFEKLSTRKFVSIHSSWAYFCKRYDLDLIGEVETSPAQRGSMKRVISLVKRARNNKVRLVVAQDTPEEQQIAQKIKHELGGQVLVLDTLGLKAQEFPPDYIVELRKISVSLRDGLEK